MKKLNNFIKFFEKTTNYLNYYIADIYGRTGQIKDIIDLHEVRYYVELDEKTFADDISSVTGLKKSKVFLIFDQITIFAKTKEELELKMNMNKYNL